ncbi:hypothetical protein QOZ80_2AG0106560 [Eleusine coracana subsp. coracana]|nr:hypothetical protein QOZ80_2AG0106560 [Eleusine coracana subsp. coracana]
MAAGWEAPPAGNTLRLGRILSSRLYFDVPCSKAPVVYSPDYDITFHGFEKQHPFDSSKWGRVCNFLVETGLLQKDRMVEPLEASEEDLLVVHSESYLNSLKSSEKVARIVEVPAVALLPISLVQQKLLYPFRKQVGGSVLSVKLALERDGLSMLVEDFTTVRQRKGDMCRVMIIDLDADQGNGHEKDFGSDERVYILDMYNSEIYPFDIDQKVELDNDTKTEDYLENLDKALKVAEARFQPQLILYNAGTDILFGDSLGKLKVSPEGVVIRDEKVFKFAKDQNVPLLMLTSCGLSSLDS